METLLTIINEPGSSKSFIDYVVHLADDMRINVHLMYLQEPYDYTLGQPPAPGMAYSLQVQKKNSEEATKFFEEYVGELKKNISDKISITHSAEIEMPDKIIETWVSEKKAGIIALEGEKQKSSWLQSSANLSIINSADCPVLVIPSEASYKPFREIVYATDYKEADLPTLRNLIRMTQLYSPSITALHVTDSTDFEDKVRETGFYTMLESGTGYKKITVKTLLDKNNENAAHLINEYALSINADLLVVLKENKKFFQTLFSPDSTKKIMKESHLPMLVFRN